MTGDGAAGFCSTAPLLVAYTGSFLQRRLCLQDTGAVDRKTTSRLVSGYTSTWAHPHRQSLGPSILESRASDRSTHLGHRHGQRYRRDRKSTRLNSSHL